MHTCTEEALVTKMQPFSSSHNILRRTYTLMEHPPSAIGATLETNKIRKLSNMVKIFNLERSLFPQQELIQESNSCVYQLRHSIR